MLGSPPARVASTYAGWLNWSALPGAVHVTGVEAGGGIALAVSVNVPVKSCVGVPASMHAGAGFAHAGALGAAVAPAVGRHRRPVGTNDGHDQVVAAGEGDRSGGQD